MSERHVHRHGALNSGGSCWVLPGAVPPPQALISWSSIAPVSAPKRWVMSAIAAARSHSGPSLAARAGQFRRRVQLAR